MSAVILAVIVVMWAVVLVPMWLRRHDAATESRSVDRFSTAMRVLSRRSNGSADRRYVLMPKREPTADVHVSGAAAPRRPTRPPATEAAPARPKARPSLARRRRRALLTLAAVALLTIVLMAAGVISWPFQFVIDLVLVAFVVHLRTQAKRAAAVTRQRRRGAAVPAHLPATPPRRYLPDPDVAPAPAVAWADETTVLPAYVEPAATGTDGTAYDASTASTASPATASAGSAEGEAAWEPVAVPPPTYTMKPKAPPRRSWSPPPAARTADPAAEPAAEGTDPAAAAPAAAGADELDGILEHRWAVND